MARQKRQAELKKAGAGEGGADGKRGESARPRRESAPAGAAPRSLPRPSPWPLGPPADAPRPLSSHRTHTNTTHSHSLLFLPVSPPPPPLFSFLSGSQAKANASAQTIICQVCRSTFVCTSSRASLTDHSSNKHAKHTFEQCFPGFTD